MKKALLFNSGNGIYALPMETAVETTFNLGLIPNGSEANNVPISALGYLHSNPEELIKIISSKTSFAFWEADWYLFLAPGEGKAFLSSVFEDLANWSLTFGFNPNSYVKMVPNHAQLIDLPPVYPSSETSVFAVNDGDIYGGAHRYRFKLSEGYKDGAAVYVDEYLEIHFVKKNDDGTMEAGLQNEQIIGALRDRHVKLNDRFPSEQNEEIIATLDKYLALCKARVDDRITRGVMGELKK